MSDQVSPSEQDDMRFYIETLDGVDTSDLSDEEVLEYIERDASTGSMAYIAQKDR